MKTFLARSAALALACILTTAALWFAPGNYLHPLSMVINKRDILLSRRPPRVVLMGGSNLLTVRSAVIARETGLPVVNMGVWAGCPVHDVFDLIADDLAPGDVVVVVMEYPVLFVKEYGKDMEKDRFSFLLRPGLYSVKYLREGRPLDILRLYFGILQIKVKT